MGAPARKRGAVEGEQGRGLECAGRGGAFFFREEEEERKKESARLFLSSLSLSRALARAPPRFATPGFFWFIEHTGPRKTELARAAAGWSSVCFFRQEEEEKKSAACGGGARREGACVVFALGRAASGVGPERTVGGKSGIEKKKTFEKRVGGGACGCVEYEQKM